MTFALETRDALSALDALVEPGERVPDVWEDLPLELRNWLAAALPAGRDAGSESEFAEFVQARLVAYRRERR